MGLRPNPFRVDWFFGGLTQGSSFLATLGFEPESLRDSERTVPRSRHV
jgi:hypothetical protein